MDFLEELGPLQKKTSGDIACTNEVFGDPIHGHVKVCQCLGVSDYTGLAENQNQVQPSGGSDSCGDTTHGGQLPCSLSCPEGFTLHCAWSQQCDWKSCNHFWGNTFVQRSDRHCTDGQYAHEEEECCTCRPTTGETSDYLISEANWEKWAMPNLLPDKKTTKELLFNSQFWDIGAHAGSGDYGYNYFGGVFENGDHHAVGWCGATKVCIYAEYTSQLAFVITRRHAAELAKPFSDVLAKIAKQLTCPPSARNECVMCNRNGESKLFTSECPTRVVRWKWWWKTETLFDVTHHACFDPNACYD